ncbi:hypothetical protein [Vibrio harveyi]|uniref:hypothetical protein n=1 Tax=Vibrio harveyi TaxID=669 RepID=UPI00217DF604|nr:hypothetical protein [Vibrio harveyi]
MNFAEKFNPELESKKEPKPENDCPWQRFVNQLLTNTSEQDDIDPEDLEEIAAKMKGVFEEREIQLIGDDGFYSIPASELISHTNDSEMILHELMNVRKLRALMDEIVSHTAEDEPKDEPAKESKSALRSKKQTEKHDFDIVSGDQMFCPHTFEEKKQVARTFIRYR